MSSVSPWATKKAVRGIGPLRPASEEQHLLKHCSVVPSAEVVVKM